jgi:DNA-binding NarL/FixJ family response regulator
MIRIVIADDHTIVREGLKQLLSAADDLRVIGEAQNGHDVLKRVRENDFDVLLLDMSMPGKSGIELIKQVHAEKPKLRILVLSMHEEEQYAVRALKAGAAGYMTKESAGHSCWRQPQSRRRAFISRVAEQLHWARCRRPKARSCRLVGS